MNISKENIDALNAVIKLTIEKADYEPKVESILAQQRKRVSVPGFRQGKVPASVVKKMYGKSIMLDEVNKLVAQHLNTYITENELDLLGEPLPSEKQETIDFETMENFVFSFDIAIAPEVKVSVSKNEKIAYYNITVTDEMIEQQTESVVGRFGKSEPVEAVGEKSLLKATFVELDSKGNTKEDGIVTENTVVSLSIVKDKKEKAALLGSKVGDKLVLNAKKAFENETEIAYILKIEKEEAAVLESNFEVTINEITEFVNPELNQELFDKAFGPDCGISNKAEFNARILQDLKNNLAMESDYRFQLDAKEAIMNQVNVAFPEAFLKRWLLASNRNNEQLTPEVLENETPRFLEDLKWQLIQNNIIKANEIKLEDADILAFAMKSARLQFMQYGLSNVPDAHLEGYAKEMLQQEEQRRKMAHGAVNDKVIGFIKEAVKLDEKAISRDEFNKLFEKN